MSANYIDPSTITDAIWEWCDTETSGIEWIFTNQDGVRPPKPLGTISITTGGQVGQATYDEVDFVDGDEAPLKIDIQTFNIINVSLNIIGDTSAIEMNKLLFSVNKIGVRSLFNTKKLGFQSTSEVRDLSGTENKDNTQRRQLDVTFNVLGQLVEAISVIERVELFNVFDNTSTIVDEDTNIIE